MADDIQTRIDRLEDAIGRGVLSIRTSDGGMTTYQSIPDMTKAVTRLKREQAAASGSGGGSRTTYASFESE